MLRFGPDRLGGAAAPALGDRRGAATMEDGVAAGFDDSLPFENLRLPLDPPRAAMLKTLPPEAPELLRPCQAEPGRILC
jgi:hypothetical protein